MSLPIPLRVIVCDLLGSLSLMFKTPERVPTLEGVNVTEMVQLAAGVTVVQLLVCEKSPLATTPEITSALLPLFVNVTESALDVVPTFCAAKLTTFVDSPTFALPGEITISRLPV